MTALEVVLAIMSSIGIILGGWATVRKAHSESKNSETDRLEKHMTRQDNRIVDLEERADRSLRRERVRDDYIAQLRQHIADGHPPPPPPWPEQLTMESQEDS